MKNFNRLDAEQRRAKIYNIVSCIVICLIAFTFLFPLYWIITGSFKTKTEILSSTPVWIPSEWVMTNYENLMSKRSAPLFDFTINALKFNLFGYVFTLGETITITGPTVPAAIRWLVNTVFMSVTSMLLTCLTAAMAGYVLAKKRFFGKTVLFSLIVCAMALPKQVILIPLVREMSALNLYDTIWSVIIPIVGWPFGVFLLKQFAEGIPTEMVEACRIDGASEWRTFTDVMFPMIKPGVGACAIFTFINSWNDYFMQLIMLMGTKELTISVGIATMQGENSTDFGILMAGSALASVPIIIVFLVFQKYFTKGITMGAVKG
ncbi:MAG: carbohydrate ABC transporter permease [Oscillospiraceae bacterium]|nr:carbohydrate ABC transporter permease [Oscillospiraceae bacterium]